MKTQKPKKRRKKTWIILSLLGLGLSSVQPFLLVFSKTTSVKSAITPSYGDFTDFIHQGVYEISYPFIGSKHFLLPQEAKAHPTNMVYVDTQDIVPVLRVEKDNTEIRESLSIAQCYRVYLMNKWPKGELFTTYANQQIFARQEAKDEKGEWVPIEYEIDAWCGNSHKNISLSKDEYLLSKVLIYDGDFETDLRLVVTGWGTSNTYKGRINKEQLIYKEREKP